MSTWVATPADTAINSVTDITVVTQDVATAAGDQLVVDIWGTILNDTAAARAYVFTLDFDGLFDIEFTTGNIANHATSRNLFHLYGVLDLRSPSLSYLVNLLDTRTTVVLASGEDSTVAATHVAAKGWGTSTSDATGTTTVALKIRSANAAATQTCHLHHMSIKVLPVPRPIPFRAKYPQLLAH